jgi:hypothetical protein
MEAWHARRRQLVAPHVPEDPAAGVLQGGDA